ncbi:hypothetical protein CEDDRAFT_00420 [Frankia sp. CeD]|nr:hypothetical protein CEDDRAFT_00420 [Frankia sp. CeD]
MFAVRGEHEVFLIVGVQQCGADGVFKVVDLPSEGVGADAEGAGGVAEVGVAGGGEQSADTLFGASAVEDGPGQRGERVGSSVRGQGVGVGGGAAAGGDAEGACSGADVGAMDAELGGDVGEVSSLDFVLLA